MEIIAWGANSHGQLGLPKSEFEPARRIDIPENNISSISGGGGHTILLTDEGNLYASGWNNKGQLGNGSTVDATSFIKLNVDQKFRKVSTGWNSSAGITFDDRLFVWGNNSNCQLGFSSQEIKTIVKPIELKLPFADATRDIQFGLRHSVILLNSNKILIAGAFKHLSKTIHQTIRHNSTDFLLIVPEIPILQIASGQNHVSIVDTLNRVYGIGDNKFMQCTSNQSNTKVVKILSGWTHVGFLIESKELWLFGRNNYGQLGADTSREATGTPIKFPVHPIDDFSLGAEHGIAISKGQGDKTNIFTWGWNEHGNCGTTDFHDLLKPEKIHLESTKKVKNVYAGSGFCMVILY